tara:strand:+ start:349 stop:840 length:492 start_codon:yes stop_codon:yes gene_type:complete
MSEPKEGTITTPKTVYDLHPSRWLKEENLQGKQVTLQISKIHNETIKKQDGKVKVCPIFSFHKTERNLECNVTNRICMQAMFGDQVQTDWVGKKIVLFPSMVSMWDDEEKRMMDKPCIRIWGSPNIEEDMTVTVKLAKKKPFQMTMHATGKKERERQPGEDPE